MAEPIFHVTGDSLQPRRSLAFTTQGDFVMSPAAVPALVADGASLGTNVIDISNSTRVRSLLYTAFANWPGTNKLSILIRVIPRFTGGPTARQAFMSVGVPASSILENGVLFYSQITTGQLVFFGYDNDGTQIVLSSNITSGSPTYVSGTAQDIFMTWDGDLTTNALQFYAAGVNIGQMDSGALASRDNNETACMNFGFADGVVALSDYDIDEIAIWNTIESVPDNARTSYLTSTAFDKTISTDPGISNVVVGTGYTILGVAKVGTFDQNIIQLTGPIGSTGNTDVSTDKIDITQGESPTLDLFVFNNGVAVDITGLTAVETAFPAVNRGQTTVSNFTLVDGLTGHFRVTLTAADTLLFRAGHAMTFNCKLTITGDILYAWYRKELRVRVPTVP